MHTEGRRFDPVHLHQNLIIVIRIIMARGGKLSTSAHWKRCITWTKKRNLVLVCSVCNVSWMPVAGFDKRRVAKTKTCSEKCLKESRTRTLKERHKDKEWHRKFSIRGGKTSAQKRVLRSKDEVALYELCDKYFNNVSHNKVIIDGWDADILIEEYKLAILWNGPWHYKEMPFGNHSLSQVQNRDKIKKSLFEKEGWNVLVYEDRYFSPKEAFVDILRFVKQKRGRGDSSSSVS